MPQTDVKFPHVSVQLTGKNGNAFVILGLVANAMRRAGVPDTDIKAFREEAMQGDYDHLLRVCMKTVDVS